MPSPAQKFRGGVQGAGPPCPWTLAQAPAAPALTTLPKGPSLPWPQACTPVGEIPITLINSQMLPLRLPWEVKDRHPLSQEGLRDPTFLQPPRLGTNRTGQFRLWL